ncbi:MAG: 50S ribosomal protein L25/general stress protein Ctc [Actinomycetes bacterium]
MSETKMKAEIRTEFGKGAARRIRRADKIPAVVYGHGEQPVHVALPGHETMLAVKHANALIELDIEGGKSTLTLVKDIQRDAIKRTIDHLDLVVVRRGEKVQVEVAVHVTGEAAPETLVTVEHATVTLEAEATHIPENVEVSVEGLEAGTQIHAGDLTLPSGSTLVTDPETLVVNVSQTVSAEALEAELAEAEAEAGIEHEAPQAEAAEEAPAAEETEGSEGTEQQ